MKAIITVLGKDRIGIIAKVSNLLAENDVNILDISQTIMRDYFTMIMLCDTQKCKTSVSQLQKQLSQEGEKMGLQIRLQHEDIFNTMHRI